MRYEKDLPTYLTAAAVPVIAIENEPEAVTIGQWVPPKECILVLGNEEYGIAATLRNCCSASVRIPMFGFKKSMNVHHALAVVGQRIVEQHGGERDSRG